jgi:bacterioferritin
MWKGDSMDKEKVLQTLNELLERELAGLVRYTHYSFMVFGHTRIPIIGWLRGLARESLAHAELIGEHITALGGHPSLKIASLLETHKHSINDILHESIEHEREQVELFKKLLGQVQGHSVFLEEFARQLTSDEEMHIFEVEKMLRQPK